jgi:hypothetical protein
MTSTLETGKEYEWFLKSIAPAPRAGVMRLHLKWAGVDVDQEINEWPMLGPGGLPGPRLIELVQRLNGGTSHNISPEEVIPAIKRGMHLYAQVQRHFTEQKSDAIKWEFVYETIHSTASADAVAISDAVRTRVVFRAKQAKTLAEAREKLKGEGAEFVKALEQMVKTGEVKFT